MRGCYATRLLLAVAVALAVAACAFPMAAYAELSSSDAGSSPWGTCNWKLDDNGTLTIDPGTAGSASIAEFLGDEKGGQVKSVVFRGNVKSGASSCAGLFADLENLVSVDVSKFDTSAATSFEGMFMGCGKLTSVSGLGRLDSSKVTSLAYMFSRCSALTAVDVTGLVTSNVRDMRYMFHRCSALSAIAGLDTLDTKRVTQMYEMFSYCSALKTVNLSKMNTSGVTAFTKLFVGCKSLSSVDLGGLSTAKSIAFTGMFEGCAALTSLDLSSFDTSAATSTSGMFAGCTSLTQLTLGAKVAKLASLPPLNAGQTWRGADGRHYTDATVSGLWGRAGTYVKSAPASLAGATVKLSQSSFTYTGKALVPGVTVISKDGKTLKRAKDYQVSFSDNVNAGTATVTVTGIWDYTGSVAAAYRITPASVASTTVAQIPNQTYTGKANSPSPSVSMGGTALVKGNDYSVSYANNVKPGTAKVTITGKGNLTGSRTVTFTTVKASLADAVVGGVMDMKYTGKPLTQNLSVQVNGAKLRAGTHYSVSYKNNVKPGTASVTITGKGTYYTGSKTLTFKVRKLANTLKAKAAAKTLSVKLAKVKKGKGTTAAPVTVRKACGKVAYKNASTKASAKKLKVNAKTGKITLPKNAKKGSSYAVKVKVTAAGDATHAAASKTISVKVKVV